MSLSSAQRRLGLVGGLVLVGILGLLILVSSPFFHNRLLGRGFAALEQQYGIIGHADELDVEVVGLDVRFRGLTLATRERPDEPFFTVDEARIGFPWSALWSELSIQTLALVGPRVSVHTDPNGSSNLPSMPAASDNAVPSNPLLPIGDLAVEGLSVLWLDEARGLSVDVGPTTLALAGTESRIVGPINLTEDIVIDMDGDETRVTGLHGQLSFDGATLGLDALRVESPEGVLTTSGEIGSVLSGPTLDLTLNSTLSLAPLAVRLGQDAATGELEVVGSVVGPADNPTADISVSSDLVSWNQLGIEALNGQLQVTTTATRIDALSMTLAEGTVSVSGLVSLFNDDDTPNSVDVQWEAVAAGVLLDSLEWDRSSFPDALFGETALSGSMALEWTDLDPRSSTVTFRNLGSARGRVGETRLVGRNGSYQLTVDQSFDGARLVGTIDGVAASGSWPELGINGELEVACVDLAVCHAAFFPPPNEGWVTDILGDLGGHVAAQLEVAGSLESPSVSGLVAGTATGVGHLAPMNLSLGLSGDVDRLELSSVEVRLDENAVRGQAEVVWESGALSGGFDGELSDLADFTPLVPDGWTTPSGAVRFETDLRGTLDAPRVDLMSVDGSIALTPWFEGTPDELPVRANLDISASGALLPNVAVQGVIGTDELWWGEARLGPATVNLVYRDDATDVELDLGLPELATVGGVELSLQGERPFTGSLRVSPVLDNLSRIGDAANLPLEGELFLDATFAGSLDSPDALTAEIEVTLANGRLGDQVLALTPRRATVRYGPEVIDVDQVAVQLGASTVDVSGRLTRVGADTLRVGFRGAGEDLLALWAAAPGADTWRSDLDVKGLVTLDAAVSGWIDAPVIEAQLGIEEGYVATADHPPIDQLALQVSYTEGIAEVEQLSARWQGASIKGRGSLPLRLWAESLPASVVETLPPGRSASVRVGIESLTEDALVGYLDQTTIEEIEGLVNATIELEADQPTWDAVRASLTLEEAELTLSGVPLEQRRPTHLEIEGGRLRVGALDWGNDDDYLTIGGEVDLGERFVADLTVTGEVDLRAFSAFLTPVVTEGDALLLANVRGPLDDPEITGIIEVTNAGLRMAQPRMLVSDLNGALFLTRDTIQFHELIGEANGGRFQIEGELDLVGLRPEGTVLLVGRGMAMEVPEGVRTEVDTDLSLSLSADAVTLGGDVTVVRGAYREALLLTGGLLSALQERDSVTIVGIEEESPLDAINLNLRMVTAEDIVVDNNYADASAGFDLRVVGTIGSPALTGRAALSEGGRIRLGNRLYEVETGTVDFVDPTGIEPEFDITARTRVSGHDITVTIAGASDALTTSFQSDPPESESDIVSLLLTGRTLEDVGVAPEAAAAEQVLGLVSTEFLGAAGRSVGLDTLRVEQELSAGQVRLDSSLIASETDPGTRLTVGKNLSEQVQLIASQNLRDSGQLTWIVEYLPRSNIELRLVLDDLNDKTYEFRHALSLGGPPRRLQTTAPPRRELRVAAVQLVGDPGGLDADARSQLRLHEGDPFDFYRWQQDRDELERFFADRGFLQARVRPQRTESVDDTVTLTYDIVRGPLSILTIEGYELPDDIGRRMRDAWSRAVFDGFLLDELRALAREHMGSQGFLQSEVGAEVLDGSDDDRKEIVLRIAEGPRTSERRVAFRGNELVTTAELESFMDRQTVTTSIWADPEPLRLSLLALYQSKGMLEAQIIVEAPEFDTDTATLPVRVVEGSVFTISNVSLDGVDARPVEDIRALVGVQTGDLYSGIGLSDARTRVDQSYRQAGFNHARVSVRSTVDPTRDTVSVVLEVNEGPRQIVQELEVVGRGRTNEGLVARALQISPGQPVDQGAWNRARKRLYDTGVFRSVDIDAEPLAPTGAGAVSTEQPVRARVRLEEWPAYRLRYGLQLKDEEIPFGDRSEQNVDLGLVGDLTRQNFAGRAVTLGTAFRWDTDQRIVRGFGRIPTFFGLPITSNLFLAREHGLSGEPGFLTVVDKTILTLEQRLRPRPAVTVAYSYTYDWNHTFDPEADPDSLFGGFDETARIARLGGGVIIDTRDNLFDATRGWFHSSHIEYAPDVLGSELRFAKYTGQQFHYWPLGRGVVLASAARIGLAAGFQQDLILSERFFAGGGSTVRGYRHETLGPLFLGRPDGGNALFVVNQEVRFPIFGLIRGVGFIDAGNVFPLLSDFSLTDLKVGAGLAARGESRSYEGSTQSIRRTTLTRMAMGTRETDQPPLWIATSDLPTSPGHPFYARLTTLLDGHHFDRFVEGLCDRFYAPVMGRPSLAPGRYFRLLLVGYFEGIDSERGMAWRATDSLAVRSFLRLAVDEAPPDHSTIARTRRLIDLETHRTVFTWVQQRLVEAGRLTGKTIAIDATTLEANAAMRSIVRRDTGESYQAFLAGLATASGVETPTREGLARLDRKRKKKTSNTDWTHPHDPDAKVTKMKDGRTHLAHKAEHAVDMETGAIVAVTLQGADVGDTTTIIETAIAAAEQVEDAQANVDDRQSLEEIVGDKGYHSNQTLIDLDAVGIRSYVSEPDRGRRDWSKDPEARAPVYGNRRRMRGRRGRRLMRQRGERIERSFAHLYDTGGMRRTHLRGHTNILKRLLIHAGGFNLGLVMRHLIGIGTPRGLQGRVAAVRATLGVLMGVVRRRLTTISSSHRLIPAVRGRLASLATFAVNSSAAITCTTGC